MASQTRVQLLMQLPPLDCKWLVDAPYVCVCVCVCVCVSKRESKLTLFMMRHTHTCTHTHAYTRRLSTSAELLIDRLPQEEGTLPRDCFWKEEQPTAAHPTEREHPPLGLSELGAWLPVLEARLGSETRSCFMPLLGPPPPSFPLGKGCTKLLQVRSCWTVPACREPRSPELASRPSKDPELLLFNPTSSREDGLEARERC